MSNSSRFAVAVHVLTLMAWSEDEPIKSEQIAVSVNTNPVVIRRMLCELAEDKLVISQTGSTGGSRLGREPGEITLLDVYRAVECAGGFTLHQKSPSDECPVGVRIGAVLEDVRGEVDAAIEQVLARITIEDVVLRLKPGAARSEMKKKKQTAAVLHLNKPYPRAVH
jgi:Rrf2 family protein